MPDLDLTAIGVARTQLASEQDQLRLARLSLSAATARRDAARQRGDAESALTAANEVDQLRDQVDAALRNVRGASSVVRARADDILTLAELPEAAVASMSARHPVLLLPVRIETRFFDGGQTLKVRIFPDQAHVTAHDPALTSDEVDGLTWYWTHRWPHVDAATEQGRILAEEAWRALSTRFRPGRAAFIVRAYPPDNLGSADVAPHWGPLPTRAGEWSTAARAALLPDRWCIIGFRRDGDGRHHEIFRKWGAAVPDTLAAGPTPDPGKPAHDGGLPDDPDLLWLHDAAEAERLGMLVTVRQADLTEGATLADGVDRLAAVGVDWTLDPSQAAAGVDAHLAAHAYEGRLAFVPQGVPTNSTGTMRSGFTTDIARAREVLAPHNAPLASSDTAGQVTASALGLPAETLQAVAGADLREQAWQSALLDATWAAAGGYYVSAMLDPVARDPSINASLRQHVTAHLRASGPLPTMRIGAQPYGVLPVMPRGFFQPDVRRRAQGDIHRVTSALRELVEPLVASVPRLANVSRREDVDDVLLALLQRTPVAWSLWFRELVGPVQRLAISVDWAVRAMFQIDLTAALLGRLHCNQLTQLSELTHDDISHELRVPLVLKPEPTTDDPSRQSTMYLAEIQSLLSEPHGVDILSARKDSVALLEAFIACAAVNENINAASKTLAGQAIQLQLSDEFTSYVSTGGTFRAPYTLRVEAAPVAPAAAGTNVAVPSTPLEFAQTVLPALTGDRTLAQYVATKFGERIVLPGSLDSIDDPMHELARMHDALATLAEAPADQLEWAFRGVLDAYSTRLDAWITSLASCRLAEHRAAAPSGVHVGGWGVVEDLRPAAGEPGRESLGFVHAPSLGQAASVAVMRSARQTHRDAEGRLFDIDLTSRRVRQALHILEGVGSGQRLAALLGYRIERGLQERDVLLAQWILPLRQQCPLRSERPDDPQQVEPVEVVAARDVVDGLALLERWEADRNALLAAAGIPDGDARAGVAAVLDDVAGLADAVSDVLVAEAVHQATVGNLERSGAALAAHDRQEPAPDPEFVRTPRAGAVVSHRVGLWLARAASGPAPGWPADLRSVAEPRLDRWLGAVLGDPSRWTVSATIVRPPLPAPDGSVPDGALPTVFPLASTNVAVLGLSALSLVLAARRPGGNHPSELETRLATHFSQSAEALAIAPTPKDRLDLDTSALATLVDLAAWASDVVAAAPLSPDHLASSAEVGAGAMRAAATVDVPEATARAAALVAAMTALVASAGAALAAYRNTPGSDTAAALHDSLLRLVEVDGPDAAVVASDETLDAHADAVITRVRNRLTVAQALPLPDPAIVEPGDLPAPGVAEDREVVRARAVIRVLLGNAQPFLPVLQPTEPAPMVAALAGRDALVAHDATAVVTWLHRSALVRPQLDALAALLVHAEADGDDVAASLAVVQAPHVPDAPWIALPFGAAGPPAPGTVGIVLHAPDGIDPAAGGAGVIVDSWTESLPAREETTAVTFHYDAPGARAPQAMLLAVHPALDPDHWDFDALVGCVHEAMDLAHLRTIGAKELAPLTTFLPALFLPDTYTRDVPGVRFVELAKAAKSFGVGGIVGDHILGKA